MASPQLPEMTSDDITRSTRDHAVLRDRLEAWLGRKLPGAAVSAMDNPANGMSSETVLFDVEWDAGSPTAGPDAGRFVLRLEPQPEAVPVFPSYDLGVQARAMQLVATQTGAPVPVVRWFESDRSVLGGTFIVMERVDGRVPPDVLPYTMDGYVLGLDPEVRRRMQDATVDVLAQIHTVPVGAGTDFLEYEGDVDDSTALRRHVDHWRRYHDWVCGGRTVPVLEDAAGWLEANWPDAADGREPVLSWGDARIGNVIYGADDLPATVLDWEMAAIAPREVDLAWMSFLHTFFQDITEELGMEGIPDMLRLDDLSRRYEETSGVRPLELGWFEVYAAYRHGVIMVRVHDRQVHFGEAEPVTDPDDAVMHRERLRQLIS